MESLVVSLTSRLQTQSHENPLYKNMTDCIKKTIKWEGFGGFYKGFVSPLWGIRVCNREL